MKFPRPHDFVGAEHVRSARMLTPAEFGSWDDKIGMRSAGSSESSLASKRAGKKFEAKMQRKLKSLLGPNYLPGPWFHFTGDNNAFRKCQPDGILELSNAVLIVEIKSQHCLRAWWQLRKLYQPVVEFAFKKPVVVVEVVRTGNLVDEHPELTLPVVARQLALHASQQVKHFMVCFADSFPEESSDG